MRTVSRLRLLFFSFYDYRCRAVHSVTLCPVETMQAHHKHTACRLLVPLRLGLIGPFADRPTIGERYVYGGPGRQ